MELKRVDHVGIAVKNLEEAVNFYETAIGLKAVGYETVAEQKVKVAFLPCGRAPSPTAPSPASSRRTAPASSTSPSGWTTSTRPSRS